MITKPVVLNVHQPLRSKNDIGILINEFMKNQLPLTTLDAICSNELDLIEHPLHHITIYDLELLQIGKEVRSVIVYTLPKGPVPPIAKPLEKPNRVELTKNITEELGKFLSKSLSETYLPRAVIITAPLSTHANYYKRDVYLLTYRTRTPTEGAFNVPRATHVHTGVNDDK